MGYNSVSLDVEDDDAESMENRRCMFEFENEEELEYWKEKRIL